MSTKLLIIIGKEVPGFLVTGSIIHLCVLCGTEITNYIRPHADEDRTLLMDAEEKR